MMVIMYLWRQRVAQLKDITKDFSRPRSAGIIAVNLNEGDELIGVDLTAGKK